MMIKLRSIEQESAACRAAFSSVETGAMAWHVHHQILCVENKKRRMADPEYRARVNLQQRLRYAKGILTNPEFRAVENSRDRLWYAKKRLTYWAAAVSSLTSGVGER